MEQSELRNLLDKYAEGKCNEDEIALLEHWYLKLNESERISLSEIELKEAQDKLWAGLGLNTQPFKIIPMWIRTAAAVLLLCLSVCGYFLLRSPHNGQIQITQNKPADIVPGGNKAVLMLSNGQPLTLTGAKNGQLATQGNSRISKTGDGQVVYTSGTSRNTEVVYNTLITPRGGKYHLILSDGTQVWLNAASSITFPTAFTANQRPVEITGEVYFEVVHNAAKPFRVKANGQVVEDIGTSFNINAYPDEPMVKTTLITGLIKVSLADNLAKPAVSLKPGQAAVTRPRHGSISIKDDDTEETLAWKNEYFRFKDENITSIMRKLSRWYDIDVKYQGNVSSEGFNGRVSRNKNISTVLRILEKTNGAHFKIEGKEVTVIH